MKRRIAETTVILLLVAILFLAMIAFGASIATGTALGYPAPHEESYPGPYPGPPADFLPVIVRDIALPAPDGGKS